MNIFVGNLAPEVTEADLAELFKPFGEVKSTEVKRELFSGIGKGFGFVEMPGRNHSLALKADGRRPNVSAAAAGSPREMSMQAVQRRGDATPSHGRASRSSNVPRRQI